MSETETDTAAAWAYAETATATDYAVQRAMAKYGGAFARALAGAIAVADPENLARIKDKWPEYWAEYTRMAAYDAFRGKGPQ